MDQLARQLSLASLVKNFKTNTLKEGRDKFTPGFLRSRENLLERYWNEFRKTHESLQEVADLQENEYFSGDMYSVVELQYTQALGLLLDSQGDLVAKGSTIAAAQE